MPLRLYHSKSKTGCKRCKARRVKCDEVHPECGACTRHAVSCEYGDTSSSTVHSSANRVSKRYKTSVSSPDLDLSSKSSASPISNGQESVRDIPNSNDRALELWLIQNYTANVWDTHIPSLALVWDSKYRTLFFEHDFLLDGILAISALHLSRIYPDQPKYTHASNSYFEKASNAFRVGVENISKSNATALALASTVVMFHSLVAPPEDPYSNQIVDPLFWVRLATGSAPIFGTCMSLTAPNEILQIISEMSPKQEGPEDELDSHNREGFESLLKFGTDFEVLDANDQEIYERTLNLIGLAYKMAGKEPYAATCRRLFAVVPRMRPRFTELVNEKRPRALAILAHLYAGFRLLQADLWWLDGVAEKQIHSIDQLLPNAWKEMIAEPLRLVSIDSQTLRGNGNDRY